MFHSAVISLRLLVSLCPWTETFTRVSNIVSWDQLARVGRTWVCFTWVSSALVSSFLLRAGLVENTALSHFRVVPFLLPMPEAGIYCQNLVGVREVNFTISRGPPRTGSPQSPSLTELPAPCSRQSVNYS